MALCSSYGHHHDYYMFLQLVRSNYNSKLIFFWQENCIPYYLAGYSRYNYIEHS